MEKSAQEIVGRDITRYSQRAVMFVDGAKGSFRQQWMILRDGHATGISVVVSREGNGQPVKRQYHYRGEAYDKGPDALAAFERDADGPSTDKGEG